MSSLSFFFVFQANSSSVEASSAISEAEMALTFAYEAVSEAEQAGANVSGLLIRLNKAGDFLVRAKVAYRLGDFNEAVGLAALCSEIGGEVKDEADVLLVRAYERRGRDFWWILAGSLVGVVSVGVGGFMGWRVFKRFYYRRVLGMKPEVYVDDES